MNNNSEVQAHKCPVCSGNGLVSDGFYSKVVCQVITITTPTEQCKSCNGKGYIFSHPKMFSSPYVISKEDVEKYAKEWADNSGMPLAF